MLMTHGTFQEGEGFVSAQRATKEEEKSKIVFLFQFERKRRLRWQDSRAPDRAVNIGFTVKKVEPQTCFPNPSQSGKRMNLTLRFVSFWLIKTQSGRCRAVWFSVIILCFPIFVFKELSSFLELCTKFVKKTKKKAMRRKKIIFV